MLDRDIAGLGREDFAESPARETPKTVDSSHQDFRAELRRIIAEDAEKAANEAEPPRPVATRETPPPLQHHSRTKTAAYWMGCAIGLGAVAYGLTRAS